MNTWFSFCARLLSLSGRATAAKVELAERISEVASLIASTMASSLRAAKYLPPPTVAVLIIRPVWSAFCWALNTSMV
ncbi:hypothetical protein D3C84_673170 [compost metagenome]